MSNEFKLVPANCRQRLAAEGKAYPRSSCASCGQLSPKWKECDAILAAAPQPPALGGEPDILGKVVSFGEGLKEISWAKGKMPEFGVELIDRAHPVLLQAELARMNAMFDELATAVGFSKERCEQAGDSPLDCANQLQAEIERLNSVERSYQLREELLEQVKGERDRMIERACELSPEVDRLTARTAELEGLLREVVALDPRGEFMGWQLDGRIDAALSKPAGSEQ